MPVHSVKHLYRVKMKHIKKSVLVVLLRHMLPMPALLLAETRLVSTAIMMSRQSMVENKYSKESFVQSWLSAADPRVTK